MNRSKVMGEYFNHSFFQTMMMFVGEFFCFGTYWATLMFWPKSIEIEMEEAKAKGWILYPNVYLFAIPTACDWAATAISFFALNMLPLSIYYMMRGGIILIVAIFSVIFTGRVLYR